jgi:hypothetical protein
VNRVLIGKLEGTRSLRTSRYRRVVKMGVRKCDGKVWSGKIWFKT